MGGANDVEPIAPPASAAAPPAIEEPPEADLTEPEQPPEPEPEIEAAAAAPAPQPINVRLRGLTPRAEVTVDGEIVEPDERGRFTMPRDDEEHEIRVEAPRRTPWSVTHRADAHAVYQVSLRRLRTETPLPAASPAPSTEETPHRGVYRDLDY